MVKQVLIIEDEEPLREYLVDNARKVNPNIEIKSTGSAKEALQIAHKYNIIAFFIDIQLIDYSGLELAKQLRELKRYAFVPMVFITAVPTRELEAFRQIHCYDYIIKPFTQEQIISIFEKILIGYAREDKEDVGRIKLDMSGITQLIDPQEIIFVEYRLRKINLHFRDSVLRYKHIPLKIFAKEFPDNFVQVHQSFIININFIKEINHIKGSIVLQYNNMEIPIGRSYKKVVGEYLNEIL